MNENNTSPTTMLTTNEVAEMLRLHPATVCKYAARGDIPCIQLGSMYRYKKEVIEAWLSLKSEENETEG